MPPPRMVIIAGPAGGGKSSLFPISEMAGIDTFSNDDYCARLNGLRLGRAQPVFAGIPLEIRQQGGAAMKKFIEGHIAARKSFAFETTLRDVTFDQARHASTDGFRVEMIFVAAGPVEEHIERVKNRGELGGHSASETSLREIYVRAMRHLVTAFEENLKGNIETLAVFDNPRPASEAEDLAPSNPNLVVEMVRGNPAQILVERAPPWFDAAVRGTQFEFTRHPRREFPPFAAHPSIQVNLGRPAQLAMRASEAKSVVPNANFSQGDSFSGLSRDELDRLFNSAYNELHRLAATVNRSDPSSTLTPTTLVHEAWIKLAASHAFTANNELHFKRIAARAMRQLLVEAARRRKAEKRGGPLANFVTFDESLDAPLVHEDEVIALHTALDELERLSPRQASMVEMRFFGGLPVADAARLLGVSEETVHRDWRAAKAWLAHEIRRST